MATCPQRDLVLQRLASASTAPVHPRLMVYLWCMSRTRTNIELDDADLTAVMRRYRLRTKSEAVALALRRLAGDPMTRDEALAMRGANAIDEIPADQPPAGG